MALLGFILFGLIVGFIARAIMPGRQPLGWVATALFGMAGSFVGGLVSTLLFGGRWDQPQTAGWIGSVIGAMVVMAVAGATRSDAPLHN